MSLRNWDAATYERVSAPLEAMGREVLDRLELRGNERVLDAGCGSGRVTAALLERLPHGEVVAVDGSPAMVAETRRRLGDRVDARVDDLTTLALERPVDAILSTATFHWIADHDALFARLLAALVPGGRLVAQCGAEGNAAAVQAAARRAGERPPFARHLGGWPGPWTFATSEDTAARLHRTGYADVWTWRQDVSVTPEEPRDYFASVVLGSHLERLPAAERDAYVDAVVDELETPVTVGYVRLNVLARRPGGEF